MLAATLTLLGLIIGFSFSMATERYDLRKSYEEAEANAIGTEYVRADLLPQADGASRVRDLLRQYTDLRIRFYKTRIRRTTTRSIGDGKVQDRAVDGGFAAGDGPADAGDRRLRLAGMNDVLNSQGYTQAAWWNRIPAGAWSLMFAIAMFSNALVGFGSRRR